MGHLARIQPLAEGLNGVNRQMAKNSTVNRQKWNIFAINRQMSEPKLAVKCLFNFFTFILSNFFIIFLNFFSNNFLIFFKQYFFKI